MKKILALLLLLSQPVMAHETMIGLHAGPSVLLNPEDEVSKSGFQSEIKLLRSLEYNNHNSDLGAGFFYNTLRGDEAGQEIQVNTYGGFLEADYKFKLSERNSFGPAAKVLFGTDVSFDATDDDSNSVNGMLGAKFQHNLNLQGPFNSKLDAALYSSVLTPQNLVFLVGVNFGVRDQTRVVENKDEVRVVRVETTTTTIVNKMEEPLILDEPVMVTIKSARVLYNTAAFEIDEDLKEKVHILALYLKNNQSNWSRIRITGHTDNVGTAEYNNELSLKRSLSIKNELVNSGVPEDKIEALGMGFSKPIANNKTSAGREKNRRTEVEFFGVKDRVEFNAKIIDILK